MHALMSRLLPFLFPLFVCPAGKTLVAAAAACLLSAAVSQAQETFPAMEFVIPLYIAPILNNGTLGKRTEIPCNRDHNTKPALVLAGRRRFSYARKGVVSLPHLYVMYQDTDGGCTTAVTSRNHCFFGRLFEGSIEHCDGGTPQGDPNAEGCTQGVHAHWHNTGSVVGVVLYNRAAESNESRRVTHP